MASPIKCCYMCLENKLDTDRYFRQYKGFSFPYCIKCLSMYTTPTTIKPENAIENEDSVEQFTEPINAVKLSIAQQAADATTEFSGSWKFVIGLTLSTTVWVLWNIGNRAFDPYPWLMWNSILTVVSTFQSPLIMMSQNRQIQRDQQAATKQAELDRELVRGLHDKMNVLKLSLDKLRLNQ